MSKKYVIDNCKIYFNFVHFILKYIPCYSLAIVTIFYEYLILKYYYYKFQHFSVYSKKIIFFELNTYFIMNS